MSRKSSLLARCGRAAFGISVSAFLLGGALAAGCVTVDKGDEDNDGDDAGSNGNSNNATGDLPDSVVVRGFIRNNQGVPVAEAEITVGASMEAASDNNGLFNLNTAPNPDSVLLKVSAPDHAPQVVKVPIKPGVTNYGVPIVMQRIQSLGITPGDMGAQVFLGNGMADIFFDEPAGDPATLRFVSITPEDGPGELRFIDSDPDEALQSAGMMWFELEDEDGNPVDMPGGIVDLDVDGIVEIRDAQDWEAFIMDPDDGQWSGVKTPIDSVGTLLTFELPESGFFNVDRVFETACIYGTVSMPDEDGGMGSCGGARVKLGGTIDGVGLSSFDSIGADGSFCLSGPKALTMRLSVGEAGLNVPMPPNAGSCGNLKNCEDIGEVVVPAGGCDLDDEPVAGTFAVGDACTATAQCVGGAECFNGYCVGAGVLRVSMTFAVGSDFDLHLMTPSGTEIFFGTQEAEGGKLDVDQCGGAEICDATTHVENIVFETSAPIGSYEVWAENYTGAAAGDFTIDVSGETDQVFEGSLPAQMGAESDHFSFTVSGSDSGSLMSDGG